MLREAAKKNRTLGIIDWAWVAKVMANTSTMTAFIRI